MSRETIFRVAWYVILVVLFAIAVIKIIVVLKRAQIGDLKIWVLVFHFCVLSLLLASSIISSYTLMKEIHANNYETNIKVDLLFDVEVILTAMIILIVYIISEPTKIEIELPHSRLSNMSSQHSINSKFRPLVTEKYEKSLQKLAETQILEKNKALLQNQVKHNFQDFINNILIAVEDDSDVNDDESALNYTLMSRNDIGIMFSFLDLNVKSALSPSDDDLEPIDEYE